MTSFYGTSCANNGKDALNTPDESIHRQGMLGAMVWTLGAMVWMLGAMVWTLVAMVWMLGAMVYAVKNRLAVESTLAVISTGGLVKRNAVLFDWFPLGVYALPPRVIGFDGLGWIRYVGPDPYEAEERAALAAAERRAAEAAAKVRLVLTLGIYRLPSCDWFSCWVYTASPPVIGSRAGYIPTPLL
eukprot:1191975-Prorocentrum_minimum.AAC.1